MPGGHVCFDLQHRGQHLPLAEPGIGQRPHDRHPHRSAHQIQPQPPEEPGVRGAVAIAGPSGQIRAVDRRPRHPARHRGGVHDPAVIQPEVTRPGQHADHPLDQAEPGPQPLVITGLLRQVREHASQVLAGVTQPVRFGGEAQQRLRHRQAHQLGVGQYRRPAQPARSSQFVVDLHVQCGDEGLDVVGHTPANETLTLYGSPDFGLTRLGAASRPLGAASRPSARCRPGCRLGAVPAAS